MSETPNGTVSHDARRLLDAINDGPCDRLSLIFDALAAAEERGRRAGIEERDELRELLRNVRPLIREEFLRAGAMTERGWEKFLARVDAALAPRDSGKEG